MDQEARFEFIRDYARKCLVYRDSTLPEDVIDDLAQETCMKLWKAFGDCSEIESLKGLISKTTYYLFLDFIRRSKKFKSVYSFDFDKIESRDYETDSVFDTKRFIDSLSEDESFLFCVNVITTNASFGMQACNLGLKTSTFKTNFRRAKLSVMESYNKFFK